MTDTTTRLPGVENVEWTHVAALGADLNPVTNLIPVEPGQEAVSVPVEEGREVFYIGYFLPSGRMVAYKGME